MYRVLILDDQEKDLYGARVLVEKHFGHNAKITPYACVQDFFLNTIRPDIAVIDINMGAQSGIDVAQELNRCHPLCQIIFLTEHLGYSPDVYTTRHVGFVTKARMQDLLPKALMRAEKAFCAMASESLLLAQKSGALILPQREIIYVERMKRTSYLHTTTSVFATPQSLDMLLVSLAQQNFARCHESFVVHLGKIAELHRTLLTLITGQALPVSRTWYPVIMEALAQYIQNTML